MIIWFDDFGCIMPERKVCQNTLRYVGMAKDQPKIVLRGPIPPATVNLKGIR